MFTNKSTTALSHYEVLCERSYAANTPFCPLRGISGRPKCISQSQEKGKKGFHVKQQMSHVRIGGPR